MCSRPHTSLLGVPRSYSALIRVYRSRLIALVLGTFPATWEALPAPFPGGWERAPGMLPTAGGALPDLPEGSCAGCMPSPDKSGVVRCSLLVGKVAKRAPGGWET